MTTKVNAYMQMADSATRSLTAQIRDWSRFLIWAGQFYKYKFLDQVMIYTQRPDATACAGFDLWTRRMGRRIRRGSKGIAKLLYPTAHIDVQGYESSRFPNDFFDVAVGNVPFGQYKVNDPAYNRYGFSIHNYFLCKALDQLRPGGIMAIVTSRYTMDSKDTAARKYLAERADLLGAVRLPNSAFKANAGTDVVSDILFLQKRDEPRATLPD